MKTRRIALPLSLVLFTSCSSPIVPSCNRRTGVVLNAAGETAARDTPRTFDVTSPQNSNLAISVTWADREADVTVAATIADCGIHVGCAIGSTITALKVQSPFRELRVDGSEGKRYRISVSSDRDVTFTISVTFDTGSCT